MPNPIEMLTDPGLEDWTSPTDLTHYYEMKGGSSTINREPTAPHGGTYCARADVDAPNSPARLRVSSIPLAAARRYRLAMWHKETGAATSGFLVYDAATEKYLQPDLKTWGPPAVIPVPHADDWTYDCIEFESVDANGYHVYWSNASAASQSIYFDDVSLAATTLTANDEANIFNDGDFCYWTSATDLADWTEATAGASTITQYATSPFRGLYSCRITIDADDNSASISQSPTLIAFQHRLFFRHRESGAATVGYTIVDDTTGHYLQTDGTWAADTNTFEPAHADAWADHDLYFTAVSAGAHTITFLEGSLVTSETMDLDTVSLMQTGFASGSMGNVAMRGRR